MRNEDLLNVRHGLALTKQDPLLADFCHNRDICFANKRLAYGRLPAGNGSVGGYLVTVESDPLRGTQLYLGRSLRKAIKALILSK